MPNSYFQFKQFIVHQDRCAMKVTTDACLFGAWVAEKCRLAFSAGISKSREAGNVPDHLRIAFERMIGNSAALNVLDIGTGTGLLTLMLAQSGIGRIDSIEIDEEANAQAGENFAASPWSNRLTLYQKDVKHFNPNVKYDIIVSNPPFYENELATGDQRKNLAMHEGLTIHDLIKVIKKNIRQDGSFFLLLPFKRHEEIKTLFSRHEIQIQNLCFVRQSTKHDYFRIMLMGKLKQELPQMTEIDEIAIMNEQNQYTPEFIRLLKDYYLSL